MRGGYIEDSLKECYIQRLGKPYLKKGKQKYFLDQFAAGAGNELNGKFWNKKSSSRFAFDLYSWMAFDDSIIDFEFEYHLPGLASGGMGPNMDVYIETANEVIFVESKFSEMANLHYIDNNYLREAYYKDGIYGRKDLSKRYYDYPFANDISKFCYDIENIMSSNHWHEGIDWFEPKQETCHIVGILIHLMRHKNLYEDKNVKMLNVYYQLDGDRRSDLLAAFEAQVSRLIHIIQPLLGNIFIEYKSFSVQEMLKDNSLLSKTIKFPDDIEMQIKPFTDLADGKTRKNMK